MLAYQVDHRIDGAGQRVAAHLGKNRDLSSAAFKDCPRAVDQTCGCDAGVGDQHDTGLVARQAPDVAPQFVNAILAEYQRYRGFKIERCRHVQLLEWMT